MSKKAPQVRSTFASKTAFEALAIESGEETEEEEEVEQPTAKSEDSGPPEDKQHAELAQPQKMTKTAQRKAARLAREQAKQAKKSRNASSSVGSEHSPETNNRDVSPPGSKANPVEIPPEPEVEAQTASHSQQEDTSFVLEAAPPPKTAPSVLAPAPVTAPAPAPPPAQISASISNGHAPLEPTSPPVQTPAKSPTSASYSKPPAFPTSPIDMAMRQASQSLSVGPLGKKVDVLESTQKPQQALVTDAEKSVRDAENVKKRQSFLVRTLWTLIMIGGFLLCLLAGHAYMIVLVLGCQTLVYREVTALFALGAPKSDKDEDKGKDPWSKTLNWYFFAVTNYFLYGESIIYYFKHVVFADAQMLPFATNHRFISFMLYTIGFVGFVASLQRQYLKSQFGLFCWVHMSLLVIVLSSHFIVNNILEGLIWFWVPASLVICNDIFAYIWGITIGRTPLIKLSPKKTVEGFVGAFFSTIIFALVWGTFFMRFNYMICPVHDLGENAFSAITCTPNDVFVWREWAIFPPLRVALSAVLGRPVTTIPYAPYQLHLVVMAFFASLVAPFGGFFASGFKRAFDIKDFGHSIPGHGGMTDRMDCQFLMGVFTYVYYSSLIKEHHVNVGYVLQLIVSGLTLDEQLELMGDFKRYLEGKGVSV